MLHDAGNDILAVSTGGVSSQQRPVDGRAFQATFSDQIRNELDIPTMAVGGIVSHADINTIVAAGRADMCALGARLTGGCLFPSPCRPRAELQRTEMAEPISSRRGSAVAGGVKAPLKRLSAAAFSVHSRASGNPVLLTLILQFLLGPRFRGDERRVYRAQSP